MGLRGTAVGRVGLWGGAPLGVDPRGSVRANRVTWVGDERVSSEVGSSSVDRWASG